MIHLFGSGSAAFVAELRFPPGCMVSLENSPPHTLALADVLWLSDHVRRTYAPYFIFGDDRARPAAFPWTSPG
ncbi:hypothetical protein ABLE93_26425 [Xanthobacter sp. KR7-65]|uniref:hypothetical protein n=1 Tax=Xanthobacter sp. KR7-65 TaxID=3156612 RepID=UPI0032B3163F